MKNQYFRTIDAMKTNIINNSHSATHDLETGTHPTNSAHATTQLNAIQEPPFEQGLFSRLSDTLFGHLRAVPQPSTDTPSSANIPTDTSTSELDSDKLNKNPACNLRDQITDNANRCRNSSTVHHNSVGEKVWQTVANTVTTSSLSFRAIKGALAFFNVMNILIISSSRNSSTNDQMASIITPATLSIK